MRQATTIALALSAALLAACTTTTTTSDGATLVEPRTASDQTDADHRAAVRMELAALHYGRGQYTTALDEIKLAL